MHLNSLSQPVTSQKDSSQYSGEPNTELNEKITQLHNELESEVQQINSGNEWLEFLEHGVKKTPYLKMTGRAKPRPKVIHISKAQRRVFNGS